MCVCLCIRGAVGTPVEVVVAVPSMESGINFAKNIKINVAVLGESTWHAVIYWYKAFSQKML